MGLRKFLQTVFPAKFTSSLGNVPVSADDLGASIVHMADSHRNGLRDQLSKKGGTILRAIEDLNGPLEENDEAWKEVVCVLWAVAQSRVYAHVSDEVLANLFNTRFVAVLTALTKQRGVRTTDEDFRMAWICYSPNSPTHPSESEVLRDYAKYVLENQVKGSARRSLQLTVFQARYARALKVTAGSVYYDLILVYNGIWLSHATEFFEKLEPDL